MSIIGKAIILGKKAEAANQVALISFTISGLGTFQAENNMTWNDWVNSSYNINGYSIYQSCILVQESPRRVILDSTGYSNIPITDTIIENYIYHYGRIQPW